MQTADLYDEYSNQLSIVDLQFRTYGQKSAFHGPIETVKVFEDNSFVKKTLATPGNNRVLVVDGGASLRCALLGDNLAQLAIDQQWAGLIIFGAIRDSAIIQTMPIGVMALGTIPRKTIKKDRGDVGIPVSFGGVTFQPGHYLYADADGIVVAQKALHHT